MAPPSGWSTGVYCNQRVENPYYEYTNKTCGGRLEIEYDLEPDQYDVSIYLDSGYPVSGRIPITVNKGRPKRR